MSDATRNVEAEVKMDYKRLDKRLHLTSSIDLLPNMYGKPNKKRKKGDSDVYEVERLVAKRCIYVVSNTCVQYLNL